MSTNSVFIHDYLTLEIESQVWNKLNFPLKTHASLISVLYLFSWSVNYDVSGYFRCLFQPACTPHFHHLWNGSQTSCSALLRCYFTLRMDCIWSFGLLEWLKIVFRDCYVTRNYFLLTWSSSHFSWEMWWWKLVIFGKLIAVTSEISGFDSDSYSSVV